MDIKYEKQLKWTLQEVSDIFEISKPTLRYYESEELLHPQRNDSSNYREYPLLALVELSDIILYRNLNLSVKEIRDIMALPVEATSAALDQAIITTEKKVSQLLQTLQEINQRKMRIAQYTLQRAKPAQIVEEIPVKKIVPWHIGRRASTMAYMNNPYTCPYMIYIPDLNHPNQVLEGLAITTETTEEDLLWQVPCEKKRYMECLIRTTYAYLEIIGLDDLLASIRDSGYEPKELIAEFLVSDVDSQDGKKYDYFRAWIELN